MGRRYACVREALRSSPRRWLVTGVAGFIGSHLLETLLELDQTVAGLDNFATGSRKNLHDVLNSVSAERAKRFRFLKGDIRDPFMCLTAMRNVDIVLHQAALASVPRSIADPVATHANNVDGFLNVLSAARAAGIERIVYASSSSVYGDDQSPEKSEERIGKPLSPYAASKLVNEIYASTHQRVFALESVGLRYFNVFGPRQDPKGPYAAVIPRWIELLMAGKPCVIYGDADKSRDFCYVANVVQANLLAACAASDDLPPVLNIGAGKRTTLQQLFREIRARVTYIRPEAKNDDLSPEPPRAGDIAHSLASIALAKKALGYEPEFDVARGLDQTVPWYASLLESRVGLAV